MDKKDCLRELKSADDLLCMLEHLIDGYARGDVLVDEVPWLGLRHTILHSRSSITNAYNIIGADYLDEDRSVEEEEPVVRSPKVAGRGPVSTLSGRIRRSPSQAGAEGQRVRELGSGSPTSRSVGNSGEEGGSGSRNISSASNEE